MKFDDIRQFERNIFIHFDYFTPKSSSKFEPTFYASSITGIP
jgi:hypothetical protein